MACPFCQSTRIKEKHAEFALYGVKVGRFPAFLCRDCRKEWFSQDI